MYTSPLLSYSGVFGIPGCSYHSRLLLGLFCARIFAWFCVWIFVGFTEFFIGMLAKINPVALTAI